MSEPDAVGVDWSAGTWLAVVYTGDTYSHIRVEDEIEDIWTAYAGDGTRIVVDIPIGLFEQSDAQPGRKLVRRCDSTARTVVGPQYRSVFNPPCREVVEAKLAGRSYTEVKDRQREITGVGLTRQAYAISEGIAQVDQLVCGQADPSRLVEGHPEVCFRAFAGAQLEWSKRTMAGVTERLEALDRYAPDPTETLREIGQALQSTSDRRVGLDDTLDAIALALTAGASERELWHLPNDQGEPPTDEKGLPMQMVYRAPEPIA